MYLDKSSLVVSIFKGAREGGGRGGGNLLFSCQSLTLEYYYRVRCEQNLYSVFECTLSLVMTSFCTHSKSVSVNPVSSCSPSLVIGKKRKWWSRSPNPKVAN